MHRVRHVRYSLPARVFQMNKKKAYITDRDACMECGACKRNCPVAAIEVKSGVGCASAVINGFFGKTDAECMLLR